MIVAEESLGLIHGRRHLLLGAGKGLLRESSHILVGVGRCYRWHSVSQGPCCIFTVCNVTSYDAFLHGTAILLERRILGCVGRLESHLGRRREVRTRRHLIEIDLGNIDIFGGVRLLIEFKLVLGMFVLKA